MKFTFDKRLLYNRNEVFMKNDKIKQIVKDILMLVCAASISFTSVYVFVIPSNFSFCFWMELVQFYMRLPILI